MNSAKSSQPSPPPQIELFEPRRELISTLLGHLKLEDWALYPRLIDSGDAELSTAGKAFKEGWAGLRRCSSPIATGGPPPASIMIGPDCADTRSILEALMQRLRREKRELFPLLKRLDQAA